MSNGPISLMQALQLLGFVAAVAVVFWTLRYAVWGWIRLERKRRAARAVRPLATQLWVQDESLLWIQSTDTTGVWIIGTKPDGTAVRWFDSWGEWEARVRNNVVWYSGQTRPLDLG